jgi:hypothetical protein
MLAPDEAVAVGEVVALGYHAVSEDWPSPYAVTPGQLERQ